MLPLLVVGGVISAVVSAVQGESWLSGQMDAAKNSTSVGGKGEAKPPTEAKTSRFEAALAAQVAGPNVPVSTPAPTNLPPLNSPDQDIQQRMKAGMSAYNHIGEHRDHNSKRAPGTGDQAAALS